MYEKRGGGGAWVPNVCASKMARPEFPDCKFRSLPRWSLWSGGVQGDTPPHLLRCTAILIPPGGGGGGPIKAGGAGCPAIREVGVGGCRGSGVGGWDRLGPRPKQVFEERSGGGGGGPGTQNVVDQKSPKSIAPPVKFISSRHEIWVRGGGGGSPYGCQPHQYILALANSSRPIHPRTQTRRRFLRKDKNS